MHPNYFIMLISFISPLQDFTSRQRPVSIQGPQPSTEEPSITYCESHARLHGQIIVICCNTNTGRCEKRNQEEKETQGSGAALRNLAILLWERGEGFGYLGEPPGVKHGLAGRRWGSLTLLLGSVFSDSTHSLAVWQGLAGAARVSRYQYNSFSSSCLPFPVPPDARSPGLPKTKMSPGGQMPKDSTWPVGRGTGMHWHW